MPRLTCHCLYSLAPVIGRAKFYLADISAGQFIFRLGDQKQRPLDPAR